MTQEFVTLPSEVVERALAALDAEDPYRAGIALRAALEQPQRKLTPQDIADSALLGNIESPFNACMHQEHCKRWKAQAEQHVADHQRESSIDNDLPSENGQLITTSSSVPFGYKLAPVEPTVEMLRAGCGSESPAMFRESLTDKQIDAIAESMPGGLDGFLKGWGWRQFARAVLEAAPQPTTVKECLTDELKPRFSAHDDAERLKSVARGMSYNDHGEAVWKHTLMEIAVRLESGGYAAPQPPALEQQVEKESTCKDSLQVEQEPVAEHELKDVRCECCGYMTHHREHMGCIRAAQPKRLPLTDEQIIRMVNQAGWDAVNLEDGFGGRIRRYTEILEAAHNIK